MTLPTSLDSLVLPKPFFNEQSAEKRTWIPAVRCSEMRLCGFGNLKKFGQHNPDTLDGRGLSVVP
jgi:hypothetical protein